MIVCANCRNSPRPCHWHFLLEWIGTDQPEFGTIHANDIKSWKMIPNEGNPKHTYEPSNESELPRTFEKNKKNHFCIYSLEYFIFRFGRALVNQKSYSARRNESGSVINHLQENYSSTLTQGLAGGVGKHLTSHAANQQVQSRRIIDEIGIPEHVKKIEGKQFYRETPGDFCNIINIFVIFEYDVHIYFRR